VFFLNSNGMDVLLNKTSVTYRCAEQHGTGQHSTARRSAATEATTAVRRLRQQP
jgi:hypothetical protein